MFDNYKYVVKLPFKGHIDSSASPDAEGNYRVHYSAALRGLDNNILLTDYMLEKPDCVIVDNDTLDLLIQKYDKSLETLPTEISTDRFMEMLEVLPPCRWQRLGGYEVFHSSEGLTGDLVAWFAQGNGKSYEFTQSKYLKKEEIINLLERVQNEL